MIGNDGSWVDTEVNQLRDAIERMHGGAARFSQSAPVREIFEDKIAWEGVVHVFDLDRPSNRNPRLRLVLADRGEYEAVVLRGAAPAASR
jgi:hypothetical protein